MVHPAITSTSYRAAERRNLTFSCRFLFRFCQIPAFCGPLECRRGFPSSRKVAPRRPDPRLERIGKTLNRLGATDADLLVTPQKRKRAAALELVRQPRDRSAPLLFAARPFLLCGLPLKRPPAGTLVHERRNGHFALQVCGHPDYGLPFGQDRLVPIWVATQAVRLKTREFSFRAGAEVLAEFGLPLDGPHYNRLMLGFQRVFASTIFFGSNKPGQDVPVWDCRRFAFFDRLRLWTGPDGEKRENSIVLSEPFWHEISRHPVPVEREVIRALANSPGALDLYMWLRWRSFGCTRPQRIPLHGRSGLAQQLGGAEYGRDRDFRRTLERWLKTIKLFWPECPVGLVRDNAFLALTPRSKST